MYIYVYIVALQARICLFRTNGGNIFYSLYLNAVGARPQKSSVCVEEKKNKMRKQTINDLRWRDINGKKREKTEAKMKMKKNVVSVAERY